MEKAEKHILLVSANLDAEVISTVQKNEKELKRYANVPKREIFHITKTSQDPFEKIISQVNANSSLFRSHIHTLKLKVESAVLICK